MIRRPDEHLPVRWLADLRDGTLAPTRAAEAQAHLDTGCERCASRRDALRRMVESIARGPLDAPPAAVDRRVRAALDRARAAARRPAPRRDVITGELVLDRSPDLVLQMRAAGADARQLLWRIGPWEMDATVVARDGRADVLGQVVPADDGTLRTPRGEVRLVRGRRVVARCALADDGRFTFRGVASGACVVEGELDGRAFRLPPWVID